MTREFIQLKINELYDEGKRGQDLLKDMVAWIHSQEVDEYTKLRIISDLNSYENMEFMNINT